MARRCRGACTADHGLTRLDLEQVQAFDDLQWPAERKAVVASSDTPNCAAVPISCGPIMHVARLKIAAPATARPGQVVPITATVAVSSNAARVIGTPATSAVLVVHDGRVVARSAGAGSSIPLILRAGSTRPAQAVPSSARLTTCDGTALPAGHYLLVGVLGYRLDPLNAAVDGGPVPQRGFALVSDPVPISVR